MKMKAQDNKGPDLTQMFENMQISIVGGKGDDDNSLISDSGSDDESEDQHFKEDPNYVSAKHIKHTTMEERDREDMDFPDEVDTPLKEARKRFMKYRGVKSLKHCDWDPYENLPVEYSKIFRFQHTEAELRQQREVVKNEGLPMNGTYLGLVLEVENDEVFDELEAKNPKFLIASTLFPHEMKITTMHFKIKRTLENNEIVPSKQLMEFACGFRRLVIRPTFCKEINPSGKNDKYRYMRFLRKD